MFKAPLVLNCPYHTLAYFVKLHNRSKQAEKVIDKELGRGHTNQLESANSALIRFRKKCWNLQRVHYITATNLGLLESNLIPRYPGYHRLQKVLPVINHMKTKCRENYNPHPQNSLDEAMIPFTGISSIL